MGLTMLNFDKCREFLMLTIRTGLRALRLTPHYFRHLTQKLRFVKNVDNGHGSTGVVKQYVDTFDDCSYAIKRMEFCPNEV